MVFKKMLAAVFLSALLIIWASPAQAYVDPGIGGMFYQIVVLLGAAVAGFFAIFRNKLKNLFGGAKSKRADSDEQ